MTLTEPGFGQTEARSMLYAALFLAYELCKAKAASAEVAPEQASESVEPDAVDPSAFAFSPEIEAEIENEINKTVKDWESTFKLFEQNDNHAVLVQAGDRARQLAQQHMPNANISTSEDIDEAEFEDPREELVDQLLEYQRYQAAAKHLEAKAAARQREYTREAMAAPADEVMSSPSGRSIDVRWPHGNAVPG